MLRVHIKPTSIWLYPYALHRCYKLEKTLGVYDIYKNRYTAFLYEFDEEDKATHTGVLKVPRGFGIQEIKECLDFENITYTVIDNTAIFASPRKTAFSMIKPPRNKEQEESIDFLNKGSGSQKMLCLDVGRGKTYCAVHFIKDQGYAAMIISYNLSEQWYNKITEYTDCVGGKDVILIVGSSLLEEYVNNKKRPAVKCYICSMTTLVQFAKTNGPSALQRMAENLGVGIKIFDETHNRFLQFNMIDQNMQVAKTVYLTATPGRSNYNEKRMFAKIYRHVEAYGNTARGFNDHYTVKYITYDSKANRRIIETFKTVRGFHSISYSRYLFDAYPQFVYELVKAYMTPIFNTDKDARILIVIDCLRDMELVKQQFEQDPYVISQGLTVGAYCMLVKQMKEREIQLTKNIIIGSIGSMQNGKDIPNLRAVFPFTQFSSPIVTQQLLGRLRPIEGKEVIYYDIADRSVYDIMKQRNNRRKILEPRSTQAVTEDILPDMHSITIPERKETDMFPRSVMISR
jgi:superfamily II DNA or RNA helicase